MAKRLKVCEWVFGQRIIWHLPCILSFNPFDKLRRLRDMWTAADPCPRTEAASKVLKWDLL